MYTRSGWDDVARVSAGQLGSKAPVGFAEKGMLLLLLSLTLSTLLTLSREISF